MISSTFPHTKAALENSALFVAYREKPVRKSHNSQVSNWVCDMIIQYVTLSVAVASVDHVQWFKSAFIIKAQSWNASKPFNNFE